MYEVMPFYFTSSGSGPSINLMRVGGARVYVKLIEPQPPNLPPGIVLVEMPANCYIEVAEHGAL